jgi:p-aminobenzoyl-glutamate transporter AbgT
LSLVAAAVAAAVVVVVVVAVAAAAAVAVAVAVVRIETNEVLNFSNCLRNENLFWFLTRFKE